MEFPISYTLMIVWIILMLGLSDNYLRLSTSILGVLIGLSLTFEDLWIIFTYNYSSTYSYSGSNLITTFTTFTPSNQIVSIPTVFDPYLGLFICLLSIGAGIIIGMGIYEQRRNK